MNNDWFQQARCKGMDPAIFIPLREEGRASHVDISNAKKVCKYCPVTEQCLDYGLMERAGVYGNTSAKERRAIRKERKALAND